MESEVDITSSLIVVPAEKIHEDKTLGYLLYNVEHTLCYTGVSRFPTHIMACKREYKYCAHRDTNQGNS